MNKMLGLYLKARYSPQGKVAAMATGTAGVLAVVLDPRTFR